MSDKEAKLLLDTANRARTKARTATTTRELLVLALIEIGALYMLLQIEGTE